MTAVSRPEEGMREMAELLRSGAKMLGYNCPECSSPLFQLKSGEVWCARCRRRVVIVAEDEDESTATRELLWESLERTLVDKLSTVNSLLSAEAEPAKMREFAEVISVLLSSLDRLRRIRKT
ncbi:MAG: Sjogren's syndrome/scleroderma autoantigen 1 family protein [Candidatus Bathyarchaeia archaeon]